MKAACASCSTTNQIGLSDFGHSVKPARGQTVSQGDQSPEGHDMTLTLTTRSRRTIVASSAAIVAAVIVAITVLGGGGSTTTAAEVPPDASFELFDGGQATFAQFEGQPLIVNFWASWCPACVAELPEFQSVHEQYEDQVTFLGLANSDQRQAALNLAGSVGLTYTLADDPSGDLFRSFDLIAMPSTIFIDANGEIVEVFGGQLTEEALADRLGELVEAS
jgi:cytochrome c biogenesis protein CcmG/thiol:disulfide interchange protein DsbE